MWRWIEEHAAARPQATAIGFEGEAIAYAGLQRRILACTAMLAARGIGRGDRVAFLGANHPAQLVLLFACARLGAIQVPLNWRLAAPELRFILEDSGAGLLLATADMAEAAHRALPPGCALLAAEAAEADAPAPAAMGGDDDPVLLVYTSGTTGRPKGALLDQRAVRTNALNAEHAFGLTAADRVLTVLPMFHVGGLNIQTTPALMAGAEVVLLPRFDPAAFLAALAAHRPTLTLLVPAVMQALVAHPGWAAADLSSLRAAGAGSSEVPLPLIEAFHARGVPVQQVYGATETCPIAIVQTRAEALAAPGSLGRPALHAAARVVDAAGRALPDGMPGEIQLRGANLARGYWQAPEATEAAFRGGWFASGDVGVRDAEGRYWFTDRLKHVIISGGENIYPAELERVLRDAPGVAEGAVCGRPDPRWGEVPVLVVVPGEGFDRDALLRHFAGQLARFKHPRDVVVVPALPRTVLGKVQVEALRALARGG
ncbi:class I adenylate-forming enzyme family protein [Paracraurococcus lichenis]|uniref:AMP-binding protein n=1 Tax=Paracraurococcus lichenis TaxID=3064888 RepID=A0ABT9E663_9PROT|nr:AMP-binding protein [Paracraurococcus sp. LOR1-02]MDO9711670.1 AMP-binding protein [Paracraurococcus sp. LOR1-02]